MESGGEAVAGSETNSAAKETPSVLSTYQSREVEFADQQESPERTSSSGNMVKQNGEEYDEGADERMLKDESTQKIAKESTEVKCLNFLLVNYLSVAPILKVKTGAMTRLHSGGSSYECNHPTK